jgi:hypothetical protein
LMVDSKVEKRVEKMVGLMAAWKVVQWDCR